MSRLNEIEARANAATEGPWMPNIRGVGCQQGHILSARESPNWSADVEFAAHARTDVPALVAALRAALAIHVEREWRPFDGLYLGGTVCDHCRRGYPCRTVTTIHRHLGANK